MFFLLSCFLVGPLLCCFLVLICSCFCFCFCLFYLLLVLFPSLFSCLSFLTFLFSCCPFTFLLSCFASFLSYFLVVSCSCCAGSCRAVSLVVPCRAVQFFPSLLSVLCRFSARVCRPALPVALVFAVVPCVGTCRVFFPCHEICYSMPFVAVPCCVVPL